MARTFSNTAYTSLFPVDGGGEVWLALLKLEGTTDTFYVVNNNEDITSQGQLYSAYPFDIALPNETGDQVPEVTLRIDNVNRMLTDWVRRESTPPKVRLQLILASSPDTIEVEVDYLTLENVSWTATTIQGRLIVEDRMNDKFPSAGHKYDPSQFPGIF